MVEGTLVGAGLEGKKESFILGGSVLRQAFRLVGFGPDFWPATCLGIFFGSLGKKSSPLDIGADGQSGSSDCSPWVFGGPFQRLRPLGFMGSLGV